MANAAKFELGIHVLDGALSSIDHGLSLGNLLLVVSLWSVYNIHLFRCVKSGRFIERAHNLQVEAVNDILDKRHALVEISICSDKIRFEYSLKKVRVVVYR